MGLFGVFFFAVSCIFEVKLLFLLLFLVPRFEEVDINLLVQEVILILLLNKIVFIVHGLIWSWALVLIRPLSVYLVSILCLILEHKHFELVR